MSRYDRAVRETISVLQKRYMLFSTISLMGFEMKHFLLLVLKQIPICKGRSGVKIKSSLVITDQGKCSKCVLFEMNTLCKIV